MIPEQYTIVGLDIRKSLLKYSHDSELAETLSRLRNKGVERK